MAPIQKLPDELYLKILGHCTPGSFKQLRGVDSTWLRLTGDLSAQRRVLAPLLLAALATIHLCRNSTEQLQNEQAQSVIQLATAMCCRQPAPGGAATSWIDLVQQAQKAAQLATTYARRDKLRQKLSAGIWTSLCTLFCGGVVLSGLLGDQGRELDCVGLLALGTGVLLVTLLFGLLSPCIWFVYNVVGMIVEERAKAAEQQLNTALHNRYADIDALLAVALHKPPQAA